MASMMAEGDKLRSMLAVDAIHTQRMSELEKENAELRAGVVRLREALALYVKTRVHDFGHGEDCVKRCCGDDECDGTVESDDNPPHPEVCPECEGKPCDCGLVKVFEAYVLAKNTLAATSKLAGGSS